MEMWWLMWRLIGGDVAAYWIVIGGDMETHWWRSGDSLVEMWWLFYRAPDHWSRGPGFESGISNNDPDALQDHCVIM